MKQLLKVLKNNFLWLSVGMFRIFIFLALLFSPFSVDAQMLSVNDVKKTKITTKENVELPKSLDDVQDETEGPTLEELTRQNASSDGVLQMLSDAVDDNKATVNENAENDKQQEEDIFIPEDELYLLNKAPTFDGSERGGQAFVEVDDEGRMKKADNIFLFYDNFKITNYISKMATCDVRFNILSNLDRKITQLDIKLVWPEMTTTLSFSNVDPNTQTYYNYSLIGDGCYDMDVAPNIIVNRCRIKGMTASECANKLVWLSK